jgi:GNAT superfamily N-acetyltransferase
MSRNPHNDSMQDMNYIIRTMRREDIDMAVEWAAIEGWNPGLHDADCYHAADPHGFLMGLLGDEPVATISVVRYGGSFGFLGFYIVKPAFRGKGYGMRIWNSGLEYLAGCSIGLDGVVAQQDNYKKSGFNLAYRNIRYEGTGSGDAPPNAQIVQLRSLPFEIVDAYDRPFFPANRSRFIQSWISQSDCDALGIMHNGRLAGYGVVRRCRSGYKIGPLFADRPELAEALFMALKSRTLPSQPLYLDVPEVNREAMALAQRHDMKASFETARMYTGQQPEMPVNRIFGVTSFEIG